MPRLIHCERKPKVHLGINLIRTAFTGSDSFPGPLSKNLNHNPTIRMLEMLGRTMVSTLSPVRSGYHTGNRQHTGSRCPGPHQRSSRGHNSAPRGVKVIDKQYRSAFNATGPQNLESALHRPPSVNRVHSRSVPPRVLRPDETSIVQRQPQFFRDRPRYDLRLIEPSPSLSKPVERHGHYDVGGQLFTMAQTGLTQKAPKSRANVRGGLQKEDTGFQRAGI